MAAVRPNRFALSVARMPSANRDQLVHKPVGVAISTHH